MLMEDFFKECEEIRRKNMPVELRDVKTVLTKLASGKLSKPEMVELAKQTLAKL